MERDSCEYIMSFSDVNLESSVNNAMKTYGKVKGHGYGYKVQLTGPMLTKPFLSATLCAMRLSTSLLNLTKKLFVKSSEAPACGGGPHTNRNQSPRATREGLALIARRQMLSSSRTNTQEGMTGRHQ